MRGSAEKVWAQQNGSPVQSPTCAQPFPTELSQPLIHTPGGPSHSIHRAGGQSKPACLFPKPNESPSFPTHLQAIYSWEPTPHPSSLNTADKLVNSFIKHCTGKIHTYTQSQCRSCSRFRFLNTGNQIVPHQGACPPFTLFS